jgi:hypothetical protein
VVTNCNFSPPKKKSHYSLSFFGQQVVKFHPKKKKKKTLIYWEITDGDKEIKLEFNQMEMGIYHNVFCIWIMVGFSKLYHFWTR